MRLLNAARIGDTQVAVDAYNPTGRIMRVGFDPLSYAKVDGVSVRKRAISTAPGVVVPARGAITIGGETYIVGHGAPDYWRGKPIRVSYVIQGADGLAELTSISSALAGAAPRTAYAALVFSKYMPDANDSSKYPPQYQLFLAGCEDAPADSLIRLSGVWYLVKESYISTSGLRVTLVNEVAGPAFETALFSSNTYDPVRDERTPVSGSVPVFRIKWSEHFSYMSQASETFQRGDEQVFMLKSVTAKPQDTLALSDGVWRILSVRDEGVQWCCHVRRA